jgi:hypothetical protein
MNSKVRVDGVLVIAAASLDTLIREKKIHGEKSSAEISATSLMPQTVARGLKQTSVSDSP